MRGANRPCTLWTLGLCSNERKGGGVLVRRMAVALALVIAACGGGDDESSTTAGSTVAEQSPTNTESTVAEQSPANTESTVADDGSCEPDDPTSLSSGWVRHESPSGGFEFSYPEGWEDVSGQAVVRAGEIVASETLDAAGIDEDSEVFYAIVRDPAGINMTVSSLDGVEAPLDVVYGQQEAQTSRAAGLEEVLGTGDEACVDGEPALGFDFLFSAPRADTGVEATFYQRTWVVLHDGTLHLVQLLSLDEGDEGDGAIIDEALRTWLWVDTTGGGEDASDGASFVEAHMASSVDTSADEPDPSTYTDTFAVDHPAIFVVYLLDEDAEVLITWSLDGEELLQGSQQAPGGGWVEFHINPEPGGFEPGQWEVVLEIVGGDDREVLAFTVTG